MTAGGSTGGNETIQDRIAEYVFAIKKNIGRYDPSGKIRRGVRGVVLGAGLGFTALAGSCGGYFEIQNHLVQERGSYTGRVQNVSRNGVGWPKTCDGRLRLKGSIGGMGGGDGDATWDFSLDTRGEQGQEEMMEFIHAQKSKNVTLHYTKPWQVWPWRGKNEGALVYLVELAEEVASENVLEEAEK